MCRSHLFYSDVESAVNAIGFWIILRHIGGTTLDTLESDAHLYTRQMKDLGKDKQCLHYSIKRQGFLNLMARDNVDSPTRLQGMALSNDDVELLKEDPFFVAALDSWEGLLQCLFGQHVQHADSTIKNGHDYFEKAHFCSPEIWWDTLLRGISCFRAARQTGKKKYAKLGNKMRMKVKRWIKLGNPNLEHYDSFLDAEWKLYRGKRASAIEKYIKTIQVAGRRGYQHDAAFASERLGALHLTSGDTEEALYRIQQSIKYWRGWGSAAKVYHVEREYSELLPQRQQVHDDAVTAISSITGPLPTCSSSEFLFG